jgi:PleD family two-component response regulator
VSKPSTDTPLHRTPIILAIDGQEWTLRSYESVIGPRGFAVTRAYTGKQGLSLVRAIRPDAVLVSSRLPDLSTVGFLEALRDSLPGAAALPVIVTTAGHDASPHRVELLKAGAWSVVSPSTDPEAFVAQLEVLVRAKLETDRLRDSALVDEQTGFYSLRGLARRARELAADAYRRSAPLACVVVGAVGDTADGALDDAAVRDLAAALRRVGRHSDVIGRVSARQFAIVATVDLEQGVDAVLARVRQAMQVDGTAAEPVELTYGLAQVPNYREAALPVDDLLQRASTQAHRRSVVGMPLPS